MGEAARAVGLAGCVCAEFLYALNCRIEAKASFCGARESEAIKILEKSGALATPIPIALNTAQMKLRSIHAQRMVVRFGNRRNCVL